MRILLPLTILASCSGPGVQAQHISVADWRPCAMSAIMLVCSDSLDERGCEQLQRAIKWINRELPGAMYYGGRMAMLPGETPTAMNVIIVGPKNVHDGSKNATFMSTNVMADKSTGCAVWTWIEVQRDLKPFSTDHIHLAFVHELLHALGVAHMPLVNSTMATSSPGFIGEPAVDAELASTLDALYPHRHEGRLN